MKVDPKFVADHSESVLAARFMTNVESGQEHIVAREADWSSVRRRQRTLDSPSTIDEAIFPAFSAPS